MPFTRALYRRQFVNGEDISGAHVLAGAATDAGLPGGELASAIRRQEIEDELRAATAAAWELGVRGVPSIVTAGALFSGDDRLPPAAEHLSTHPK